MAGQWQSRRGVWWQARCSNSVRQTRTSKLSAVYLSNNSLSTSSLWVYLSWSLAILRNFDVIRNGAFWLHYVATISYCHGNSSVIQIFIYFRCHCAVILANLVWFFGRQFYHLIVVMGTVALEQVSTSVASHYLENHNLHLLSLVPRPPSLIFSPFSRYVQEGGLGMRLTSPLCVRKKVSQD